MKTCYNSSRDIIKWKKKIENEADTAKTKQTMMNLDEDDTPPGS